MGSCCRRASASPDDNATETGAGGEESSKGGAVLKKGDERVEHGVAFDSPIPIAGDRVELAARDMSDTDG